MNRWCLGLLAITSLVACDRDRTQQPVAQRPLAGEPAPQEVAQPTPGESGRRAEPVAGGAGTQPTPQPYPSDPAAAEGDRLEPGEVTPPHEPGAVQPPVASDHFGTPEDRAVLEQLRAALGDEPTLGEHVEGVAIYVYQGEITLRGVVPSQQDKQRIEERIRQAAEGRAIDSQLIVERRPR